MLISEAARGEGGRLFFYDDEGQKTYFMEDKFGTRGNLMPRDVVSREMDACGRQVYLDLTELPQAVWQKRLSDLREEIIHYLALDPAAEPVPVAPGIHYFMGGIRIDRQHRSNIPGLYAAGECACGYHGANRLGGNSLLGALYGGLRAAETICVEAEREPKEENAAEAMRAEQTNAGPGNADPAAAWKAAQTDVEISGILAESLPVLRSCEEMQEGLAQIRAVRSRLQDKQSLSYCRALLAEAFLMSALARKESRGAHTVVDYPESREEYRKTTVAVLTDGEIRIRQEAVPELEEACRKALYEQKQENSPAAGGAAGHGR